MDLNHEMLRVAAAKTDARRVGFIETDVRRMPFAEGTFDLATISFALRTLGTGPVPLRRVLAEIRRILTPGGRLVVVETSQPSSGFMRWILHRYATWAVRPAGRLLGGSDAGYAYLAQTIPRFPGADELAGILHDAGFESVRYRRLFFGVVVIHIARRSAESSPAGPADLRQAQDDRAENR